MQLRKNRYASYYDASMDDETLDNELASDTSDGLMSKEDKIKLDSIKILGDGSPVQEIPASAVKEDPNNQFVTEEEKAKLDVVVMDDYGKPCIPCTNIVLNEDHRFVSVDQVKKIDEAVCVEYNAAKGALIFK